MGALTLIAAWALFAFAGAYRWTLVPIVAGGAWLGVAVRPLVLRAPHRAIDLALVACLCVTAAQLIPVPSSAREVLSPSAAEVERALILNPNTLPRSLSLDPTSTAWALVHGTTLVLIFWSARTLFALGGSLRVTLRRIAWFGLALAAVMFVQRATTPALIYGFWRPVTRASNPTPLGPFVNRNDIAAWLLLACPLVFGYVMAHLESRAGASSGARELKSLTDSRTLWLLASGCLMSAALLASLSRSGLFGGAVALLVFTLLARRRLSTKRLGGLLVGVATVIAIAATYANLSALLQRISDTLPSNLGGRLTVWRETWPMARDFVMTGVGVGAFERAMLVYQESTRLIFFNHAHNEYLQILVEGGLLLAVPAAAVILAACWSLRRRLHEDATPVFWIRAGAASGLAAVAAQSVWDTGLRMPANAVLFAIVAAVAMHDSGRGHVQRI